MRRVILLVCTIALVFMAGTAGAEDIKIDLDIGVGYRTDKLDWDVTGLTNGVINGIYGVTKWDDLTTIYSKATVRISKNKFHAKGSLGYGRTIDGNYRESYYSDSAHQSEIYNRTADIDGYVLDASIGLGYQLGSDKAPITPFVGYSWNLQYFQTNGGLVNGTVPIPNFVISNEFHWRGPWVGVDLSLQPSDKARLYASAEYHFGNYRLQTIWNYTWSGYDQIADAQGYVLTAGLSFKVKDSWDIGLEAQYTRWTTDIGNHGYSYAGYDNLNGANWESYYGTFNVTHRFYGLNQDKRLNAL